MAEDILDHLAATDEIHIGFNRPDGSTGSTPVWIVRVADDLFVRSMNGPRGGWYRRLRADPDGEVRENGHRHRVRAEPVTDPDMRLQVTQAYQTKYQDSPYLRPFLDEDTAGATLRLKPR